MGELRIIPIISAAGGVGKTTLSLMLSYVLSTEHKVLLMDLDPTAGLTLRMFGDLGYNTILEKHKTLMDLIKDFGEGKDVNVSNYVVYGREVRKYDDDIELYPRFNNALILPPGEGFDEFFASYHNMDISDIVWNVLHKANIDEFDTVIIDTAPFFDERYTLIALNETKKAVIVLRPTITDLRRTTIMIRKINRIFRMKGKESPSFILVFNFDVLKHRIEAKTLSEILGIQFIDIDDRSGKPTTQSLAYRASAEKINEMLRRGLEEIVKMPGVRIYRYVLPYDVKYGDDSFPQLNKNLPRNRRIVEDDETILELTLQGLLKEYGIEEKIPFEISTIRDI